MPSDDLKILFCISRDQWLRNVIYSIELKQIFCHRYETGVKQALVDAENKYIVHIGGNRTLAVTYLHADDAELGTELHHE